MSVAMSLLALLESGPSYGLRLKNEFERRTSGMWPMNVGQIYSTLQRLQRDGLVEANHDPSIERNKTYTITHEGRLALKHWFSASLDRDVPARDELVMKIILAASSERVDMRTVIQVERRSLMQLLQEYTKQKRDELDDVDDAWLLLVDWLIFEAEATIRWLESCETRYAQGSRPPETELSGRERLHMDVEEMTS